MRPESYPAFLLEKHPPFGRFDLWSNNTILPLLLRFALPVLLALLLQAMYGAVDLQVVGRFGTAADISLSLIHISEPTRRV